VRSQPAAIRPHPDAPWWHRAFASAVVHDADLARAAMLFAAHVPQHAPSSTAIRGPGDVELRLAELGDLVAGCDASFESWHRRLFVELGFAGNGHEYHDVRNSLLPDVVTRRTGIPITLAIVAIETARSLGLELWGVGMPGHFLVGVSGRHTSEAAMVRGATDASATFPATGARLFLDPFHGGTLLDDAGCAALHERLFGPQPFDRRSLEPTDPAHILIRMCNNVKAVYARARDIAGLTAIMRLRTSLPELRLDEGRELVRLLHATAAWSEALHTITELRALFPDAGTILDDELGRVRASFN
jgi:regulator of sirC expression with transglutaminase-like and TPR domain